LAIVLKKFGLSIMLVPKGASTSIKHLAFEIENGYPFKPYVVNSRKRFIHQLYHSRMFNADKDTVNWNGDVFAVIRDPVDRILSCHSNRVMHYGELDSIALTDEDKELGVEARPSFELFIEHLDRYRQLSDKIKHHSLPMEKFLGNRADRYTRIFDSADLTELWEDLRQRVGTLPEVPHEQTGGADKKERTISKATLDRIYQIFANDYEAYGGFLINRTPTYTVV